MRVRILLITFLLFETITLNAQDYLAKSTKESGYIVINITALIGSDRHETYFFLENLDGLNTCAENLSDSCFSHNGFLEFYDFAVHDTYSCCMKNTSSSEKDFIPDSIADKIYLERYRMKELEKIKPITLLKDYTYFSYKNRKYRTISYYLICKADVYYCNCSKTIESSNSVRIALVKIENVKTLSNDEIMKFDNFFKKFHKTKNFKKIMLPYSVTGKTFIP